MATMEQTIREGGFDPIPSDDVFDAGTIELPDRENHLLTYGDSEVELLRRAGDLWVSVKLWPSRSADDLVAAIREAREVVYR